MENFPSGVSVFWPVPWLFITGYPNTADYWSQGYSLFVHFREPIKFGYPCPCWVEPFINCFTDPSSALMVFSSFINLVLYLLVGSLEMVLYVSVSSNSSAFFIYSTLFITTSDTPMSAVRITLVSSFLSSSIAFCSSNEIFDLGGCIFLRMALTSPLNSSASPLTIFWHVLSIDVITSIVGWCLGTTA